MSGDELMKIQSAFSDWLLTGGGPGETKYASTFNLAFKTDSKYYEWLEEPGNKARLARFGHAMNGTRYWELAENIIHGTHMSPSLVSTSPGFPVPKLGLNITIYTPEPLYNSV